MIFFFLAGEDAEDNLVSAPLQELFRCDGGGDEAEI